MSQSMQNARLYWIDDQIRAGRYPNAQSVHDYFNVSRRTAYDDRNRMLIDLKAPLILDRERNGWTYSDFTFHMPFLALAETEAATMRRMLLAAQEYLDPADDDLVQRLYARLASYLPSEMRAPPEWESVGGAMHLARSASVTPELLQACRQATRNRQKMDIVYDSAHRNATDRRIVRPYHLHNFQGEHHLIAWCEWRQDIRQFVLGRIGDWTLLPGEMAFDRQEVDVEKYLQQGLGVQHGEETRLVRVRFSPYQARWMRERRFHHSQQAEELPDGGLIVSFQAAGQAEIARWVLAYGGEAEVLEPEELRAAVAAQVQKMQKIYTE